MNALFLLKQLTDSLNVSSLDCECFIWLQHLTDSLTVRPVLYMTMNAKFIFVKMNSNMPATHTPVQFQKTVTECKEYCTAADIAKTKC